MTTKEKFLELKKKSGTHSPSISSLLAQVPELKIKIDACFLSNPYATDLYLQELNKLIKNEVEFRKKIEYYPPQNNELAKKLSEVIKVNQENIFVGNGAIECIQALLHNFFKGNTCVIIPTFSPYYEYLNQRNQLFYFQIKKENQFELVLDEYYEFITKNKIDNIILINPNNPTGSFLTKKQVVELLNKTTSLQNVLIDESFIHFANEDSEFDLISYYDLIDQFPNLSLVKSMSKDFGIAGLRLGYMVSSEKKIKRLLNDGYLWNVSGLAEHFLDCYVQPNFQSNYNLARKKFNLESKIQAEKLNQLKNFKSYSSMANFALLECLNKKAYDVMIDLLVDNGIYVRACNDKIGLEGEYIRLAYRNIEENERILEALNLI